MVERKKNGVSLQDVTVIIAIVLLNTGCYKAGTLGGGGDLHKFDCTRETLQNCLDSIAFKDRSLSPPGKWIEHTNWDEIGYEFLHGVTLYFGRSETQDERMYYITLVKNDLQDTLWTKPSYLAVRSIFIEDSEGVHWKTMREVDEKERELVEKRMEILTATFAEGCGCKRLEIISE